MPSTIPNPPPPPSNLREGWDIGYPGMAALMDMDNDLMLFRRFGSLSVRTLLYMQKKVSVLEARLKAEDERQRWSKIDLGKQDEDSPEKIKIMEELKPQLKDYVDYLEAFSQMRKHNLASKVQRESLQNWLDGRRPLIDEEQAFVKRKDDLIAISTSEKSLLDRWVGRNNWLIKLMFNKEKDFPEGGWVPRDPEMSFYSDHSVGRTVKWVVVALSLIFLIVPMLILQLVLGNNSAAVRAIFTAVFIVIFTFFMSAFTLARPAEILAATAGYSAVLVVFMANQVNGPVVGSGGSQYPAMANSTAPMMI